MAKNMYGLSPWYVRYLEENALTRALASAGLSMTPYGAADMIVDLERKGDNALATRVGRHIKWVDPEFGNRVFAEVASIELAEGFAA